MSSEVTFWVKPMLQRRWQKPDRTIDRWRESGRLPPPDTFLGHQPAWREDTILAAEAKWAQQGAERAPHQDTDKAHAAAVAAKHAGEKSRKSAPGSDRGGRRDAG